MSQVFPKDSLNNARKFSAVNFHSAWIENKGKFKFVIHDLPTEAQFAPVYGIVARDFDGDGMIDLALNGNEFSMAPYLGRYDALNGLVLMGDGKGNFHSRPIRESGFLVKGNGKALAEINLLNGMALVAVENIGELRIFRNNWNKSAPVKLAEDEFYALIYLKNGLVRKEEYPFGSGFLTQSARFINLNGNINYVEIYNGRGQKRIVKNETAPIK
jgi:hypothetical protein